MKPLLLALILLDVVRTVAISVNEIAKKTTQHVLAKIA